MAGRILPLQLSQQPTLRQQVRAVAMVVETVVLVVTEIVEIVVLAVTTTRGNSLTLHIREGDRNSGRLFLLPGTFIFPI